jgi:Rieske Fe-S protein
LEKAGLLLRRDELGWYAMSTLCTHDLSVLRRRNGPNGPMLASVYTSSTYDLNGKVLSGPAIKDLPYYELYVEQGVAEGARDTLYARIGSEKPREWRLPVPLPFQSSEAPAAVLVP